MPNPLDYLLKDHDALRYALMQDSSYRGGGAVHMEDGGSSTMQSIKNAVIPVNVRQFASHLFGDRSPITESQFTPEDLAAIRFAIEKRGGGASGSIGYGDYSPQGFSSFSDPGEGLVGMLHKSYTDPAYRMETTLGQASYRQLPDGSYVVEDKYNFNAPSRKYVNEKLKEKNIVSLAADAYKDRGLSGVLNVLGNVYGATEDEAGAPVSIRVPHFDEGGRVNIESGIDINREYNPFSVLEKPTYGSDVPSTTPSIDQQRYELTMKDRQEAENRRYRAQQGDALAGMDPNAALGVADAARTAGMAAAALPIHALRQGFHFLQNNTLAGAPTGHDYDEAMAPKTEAGAEILERINEVGPAITGSEMGFGMHPNLWAHNPPTLAQMRAGLKLGAERAAPVLSKIDQAVRSGYESGAIPQPGLSIKDVTPSSSTISENPYAVSTRLPTAVKSTENPLTHNLIVDMDTFKRDPVAFSHNVDLMEQYPSLTSKAGNAEEKAAEFKNQIKDNLLWLHDQVPTNTRERSKLWYDGARNIVDKWNQNYGVPEQASSGVFAVLSPQKDWFMNVSLGNRVMDTLLNRQNHLWDSAMNDVASQIYAKPQYQEILNAIRGKRLSELDDPALKAMWLRTYDEAKNDRAHHIITPEGNSGGIRLSGKGEPYQTGWGSNNEIAKAIKIFEDPSKENISNNLGSQHKVRNFYNNIYNPNDPSGHVTIDTHAVAAGLLSPFSGKSREVAHNFGSNVLGEIGPKNSSVSGMQGTYGLYADAYRDAAKERAILPREMQSITWEAVRGLFPDTFKTAKNSQAINDIWSQYKNGSIDLNQARQKIFDFSGGIRPPEWER